MKILFPDNSSSPHHRETGGTIRGIVIARESSTSLLDEEIIEELDNRQKHSRNNDIS
jgi:hypothetical protein